MWNYNNLWFWGDPHFAHYNIIKYCNRPYKNEHEMDNDMIRRYREVITSDATVICTGDFTIKRPSYRSYIEKIIKQLPGQKHLVLGNHDYFKPQAYIDMGFISVHTILYLEKLNIYIIHDPAISQTDTSKLFIGGHVHNLFKVQRNFINVGVDVWDFYPVPWYKIESLKKNINVQGLK